MVNPQAGEAELIVNGTPYALKLTLGALAGLEDSLEEGTLVDLVQRFEQGRFSARDVLALLAAGLQGGGHELSREALASAAITGGPMQAAKVAADLLVRSFTVPDSL
ncbi:gene transfer agent family protein [Leisingera methylohalidivorans]|uniref:Gene transfer agent protein n=1 Tax=Leisingera methylohalidivorans DSM 14336 TaxID=999552 RepID=V9VS70_9RHOB|nr:gene transfer agent family protein [Leisingera methylohalidivorans]AHD00853.1 gene transfer agent protein [Leisingera methylohalidivorans DSM 14336]